MSKEVIIVEESLARAIIKDVTAFGMFAALLYFNHAYLSGNLFIDVLFISCVLLFLIGRSSKSAHRFKSYEEAVNYLTPKDKEIRRVTMTSLDEQIQLILRDFDNAASIYNIEVKARYETAKNQVQELIAQEVREARIDMLKTFMTYEEKQPGLVDWDFLDGQLTSLELETKQSYGTLAEYGTPGEYELVDPRSFAKGDDK